jgi:hypothetical protein|tara:strand:+ start:447 stop:596 length:150 start_codon:yes stop_codon:yes gene_type:complete
MLRVLCLVSVLVATGCKTIPEFPVVWFWSHNDLLKQEREIANGFKKENN